MKRIGIVTSAKELNYGAVLQAFALQNYIEKIGYKSELLWWDNQRNSYHDIRWRKVFFMLFSLLRNPNRFLTTLRTYRHALRKEFTETSISMFEDFEKKYLRIAYMSYARMKRYANKKEVCAVICGSDQIWNSYAMYVDPFYYLRFTPRKKRIAYAPSIGKKTIPEFNKKRMYKYISEIDYLSVRESSAKKLLESLVKRSLENVCDPSFLLSVDEWKAYERKVDCCMDYILIYFLDAPSEQVKRDIQEICCQLDLQAYILPYEYDYGIDEKFIDAGPSEFLWLIRNAKLILTDSFHGTAFSINFSKPFLTYSRQYGSNEKQESRIVDLLSIVGLEKRYIEQERQISLSECLNPYDVIKLQEHVVKSKRFLNRVIECIDEDKNANESKYD